MAKIFYDRFKAAAFLGLGAREFSRLQNEEGFYWKTRACRITWPPEKSRGRGRCCAEPAAARLMGHFSEIRAAARSSKYKKSNKLEERGRVFLVF